MVFRDIFVMLVSGRQDQSALFCCKKMKIDTLSVP